MSNQINGTTKKAAKASITTNHASLVTTRRFATGEVAGPTRVPSPREPERPCGQQPAWQRPGTYDAPPLLELEQLATEDEQRSGHKADEEQVN